MPRFFLYPFEHNPKDLCPEAKKEWIVPEWGSELSILLHLKHEGWVRLDRDFQKSLTVNKIYQAHENFSTFVILFSENGLINCSKKYRGKF